MTQLISSTPLALSVVSTLYKSERHIEQFCRRVSEAARSFGGDYEIILVDDGSPDRSRDVAIALTHTDAHIHVIELSRNFGHHKAMMTGLAHARGELVFLIDSDLEEDPAWLATFHEKMRSEGADVVYGVQMRRKGSLIERLSGDLYYATLNSMLDFPLPRNVTTARLMTAHYVSQLIRHRDREVCLAALWVMTGFRQVGILVEKTDRGASTYGLGSRFAVVVNAITSFSNRPLVYIFYLGVLIMTTATLAGTILIWRVMFHGVGVAGWPSLVISIWFLSGMTIFCLGVIGMYLSKVFMETKDRPYTVIRAHYPTSVSVNMTEAGSPQHQVRDGGTFAARAAAYYAEKLKAHGVTCRGVDWSSVESQERRFAELLRICEHEPIVSITDFGCGYGALVDYLIRTGRPFEYCGYDAAPAMIDAARARFPNTPACIFTSDRSSISPRDYTVASGVFNVKLDACVTAWWDYVNQELDAMAALSRRGFAFNMLTGYSDSDRKRDDLFYPDPEVVFRYCMNRFSHSVALSHDYPLYEFTVLVRL